MPTTTERTPTLSFRPDRLIRLLVGCAVVLVVLSTIGQAIKLITGHDTAKEFIPLFHVGTEGNITTYFSALLLLTCSAFLGWIGWHRRTAAGRYWRHWIGLSAVFLYLSMDEATALHERMIVPVRELVDATGLLYFAWVIPAVAILLVLAILYFRFFLNLPDRSRKLFALGAFFYIGGAIGMELLGGRHYEIHGANTVQYSFLTTIEEMMEMGGVLIFLYGLLLHLRDHAPVLRLELGSSRSA